MGDRARAAAARVAPREAGVGLDAAGYKLGLWYAAVQTSSVAAERCFGIMRNIEAPNKRSMRSPAWRAELYFRYNKWLVDLKWDEAQVLVPRLDAAGAAPAAASAPSAYFGPPA